MFLDLDPAVRLELQEQEQGAIASIMLLLVDAPGAYGIGAARNRSGKWLRDRLRLARGWLQARACKPTRLLRDWGCAQSLGHCANVAL